MYKSAHNILIAASVALMMFGYVSQADAQRGGRDQTNEHEMRTSMREMFSGLRETMSGASDQERREMWGEMQKEMKERYEELTPKIESVLLPAQVQRLAEIRWLDQ